MKQLLMVGFGGFIGSILRYAVSTLNKQLPLLALPIGTLTVNILGSFLIGLFIGLSTKNGILNQQFQLFLITGVCGGFTTFSTFSNENIQLITSGHVATAALYIFLSLALGFGAVFAGNIVSNLF